MIVRWASILMLAAVACGGAADETDAATTGAGGAAGAPPGSCADDEVLAEGVCEHVGLPQDFWCAPGSWGYLGEVCEHAGVTSNGCGLGFVHDGDAGCRPVLPAQPCPLGTMAVPGDVACREVAPCAPGTWGDIPVDSTTQYVDPAYSGLSDGSAQQPWTTIADAIAAVAPGAIVALAAGTYAEDVVIAKPVRLWGRCPALVEIAGVSDGAAVTVDENAYAVELRALSISGSGSGLTASRADVVGEKIWVHDNPNGGIVIEDYYAKLLLQDSLVEQNGGAGIYVYQTQTQIRDSLVRDTFSDSAFATGSGIDANDSQVFVYGTVLERNHGVGMLGADSSIYAIGMLVRDTLPDVSGAYGWGIAAERSDLHVWQSVVERNHGFGIKGHYFTEMIGTVVRGTVADAAGLGGWGVAGVSDSSGPGILLMHDSLVEDNREFGVFGNGVESRVMSTMVRGTQPNDAGALGRGIHAEPFANQTSLLVVGTSVIEDNHEVGIFVGGGEAAIDTTVVRGTQLDAAGNAGGGIEVRGQPGSPGWLQLFGCLIERNHGSGVSVVGAEALFYELNIRDHAGRGVDVQRDAMLDLDASLSLFSVLIESNGEAGVSIVDATAQIEKSIVRDTRTISDGRFGDGVFAFASDAAVDVTVVQSRIEASARAAVSAFATQLSVNESQLVCQAFDIALETWNQVPSVFADLGGNWCGCPSAQHACKPMTAGIEAL